MFTKLFVELLQKKQLTVYRIAKDTGISQGLMNEYKHGIKSPTMANLIKIADYLNVSTDFLLGRTNNPEVNK
ncbi:MAG: helix-turn-helix domain-containing protein [Oscillospiraceae bacterium]|nr:helix-turn-helix domain-containing protein [Oscillospiraceae bacterium]